MGEVALAFFGGLLGSAHCIGMCGAFALAVGAGSRGWLDNLLRQCCYTLGRVFTYSCAGLTAAFLGTQLQRQLPLWIPAQACLSLFAGTILTVQGLAIFGVVQTRWLGVSGHAACQAATAFRTIMTSPSLTAVFFAGMATGFLPCALLYAYLALAARSGNLLTGALLMAAMAAGTAPLMILGGLGISTLRLNTRQQILKCAAILVLATGVTALVRGGTYWYHSNGTIPRSCPLCQEAASDTMLPSTPVPRPAGGTANGVH